MNSIFNFETIWLFDLDLKNEIKLWKNQNLNSKINV